MNPSQIVIQWNRETKQIGITPTGMDAAEVQAVLQFCVNFCSNTVIEKGQEKRVSLATGPLPPMPTN